MAGEEKLAKFGIRTVRSCVAKSESESVSCASSLHYPVALKIISKEILHKSDRGCVKVNLTNEHELRAAYRQIISSAAGAKVDGMLVQKMGRKGLELIVGGKRDPQFGQLILFGLGGIFVEVFRDVSMRICPIAESDAAEMIREIKGYPLLAGARGRKPVDEKSLVQLLVKVSKFLEKENPAELDLNPVIADENGYDIVDVRIID